MHHSPFLIGSRSLKGLRGWLVSLLIGLRFIGTLLLRRWSRRGRRYLPVVEPSYDQPDHNSNDDNPKQGQQRHPSHHRKHTKSTHHKYTPFFLLFLLGVTIVFGAKHTLRGLEPRNLQNFAATCFSTPYYRDSWWSCISFK